MAEGVQLYEADRCFTGYTLCGEDYEDGREGEGGRGKIYLVDMEGRVVHSWYTKTAQQSHCRLLPNGNLLYPTRDRSRIAEAGLRELDPASEVVWYYHCRVDHDFQLLESGNIMILALRDFMWPERLFHRVPEMRQQMLVPPFDLKLSLYQQHIISFR